MIANSEGKKYAKVFLAIFVLAVLIRIPGLFQTASMDEGAYLSREYFLNWHPPLAITAHGLARAVLGDHAWVSKLLVMLVGLCNLYLVYKLATKLCGERAGLFAAAIMAFCAYPLLASLQVDIDGSFLLLFYLATSVLFLKYMEQHEKKWLVLAGVSLGLSILTKYPGVFILPILALYHLFAEKDLLGSIKVSLAVGLIGLAVFALFPIYCQLTGSSYFLDTIGHLSKYTGDRSLSIPLLAIQYLLPLIWLGPLMLGLTAASLWTRRKGLALPIIWILAIIVFYSFINKDNFKPLERYFTILCAPLAVIIGSYLARIRLPSREIAITAVLGLVCLAGFMALNSTGYMPSFYPKTDFIGRAISLNWDFYLPITGSSGPIGFFMNFRALAFAFLIASAALVVFLVAGQKERNAAATWALIIFLSVSLAYNIFVAQEYLFSTTSPGVDRVTKEVISYSTANELGGPVYVFRNTALRYYLRDKYPDARFIDFDIENNKTRVDGLLAQNPTIIIVDFPKLQDQGYFSTAMAQCRLVQDFTDKGFAMGRIYSCGESR